MSGGQQRRLDIVMGLIHEPDPGLPRRADHRPRPAGPGQPLGAHRRPARPARRDGLPHHALPRRGRRAQRPDPHHRPRPDRRLRHLRQPQGAGRRRPRRPRGGRPGARRRRPPAKLAEPSATAAASVEVDGQHVRGRVPRAGRAVPGLLRDLDRSGIELDSIEVHRPTLDDVFLDPDRPLAARRRVRHRPPPEPTVRAPTPREESPDSDAFLRESHIVFRRQLRMNLRNPAWVHHRRCSSRCSTCCCSARCSSRSSHQFGATNAYTFFVPGMLVQLGIFGAFFAGFSADRRVARGRHRGRAGHPGQPDRAAGRPALPRRAAAASCRR